MDRTFSAPEQGKRGGRLPRAVAFCAALAAALAARGQQPAPPTSLADAIARAEAANAGFQSELFASQAADERASAAARHWLPTLAADADWGRTDVPARVFSQKLDRGTLSADDLLLANLNGPSADTNLETSVAASLELDVFGASRALARQSRANAESAARRRDSAREILRLSVVESYFGILALDRQIEAGEKALAAARSVEKEVEIRRDAGAALESDLLRVRSRRRERQIALERVRADGEMLRARFRVLLGWPAGTGFRLVPPPADDTAELSLEQWRAQALSSSPDLLAAAAESRAARESLRGAKLAGRPGIHLLAAYQDDRSRFDRGHGSGTFELRLHWDVFDFGRPGRLAAERASWLAAEAASRSASDSAALEVEARWRALGVARQEAEAAHAGRAEAEEVFRVTRERWQAGKALLSELLEAESLAAGSAAGEARADFGVAVAQAALRRAAGIL